MKISEKSAERITRLSYIGIAACLVSNLYLSDKVPEEHRVDDIKKEQVEISQTLDECDKGGYLSLERKCLDAVQQFDTLGEEAAVLQHSPAYISAQKRHHYSDIPTYIAGLLTLTSFLVVRGSAKRIKEEKNSKWKNKGDQQ